MGRRRPRAARGLLAGVLVLHGLIHLMGVAEGFDLADVDQVGSIGPAGGAAWLLATLLVLAAAGALAVPPEPGRRTWWWLLPAAAAVTSQALVLEAWSEASAGTVANLLLAAVAVHAWRHDGPRSLGARWRRAVDRAVSDLGPASADDLVTEADLAPLPPLVADYVRRSGAVGRPRVRVLDAAVHGRIRSAPDQPWMPFRGRQVNTFGSLPQRFFLVEARKAGIPATVLHVFDEHGASMCGRLASLVTMFDVSGPVMDRAETVTLLDDLVLLAPAALVDAPVEWTTLDDHRVYAAYTRAGQRVAATLFFDATGELVDLVSDDRARASDDGRELTPMRWSTPVTQRTEHDGRRLASSGEGHWHAPAPEGEFAYVEFHADEVRYDLRDVRDVLRLDPAGVGA